MDIDYFLHGKFSTTENSYLEYKVYRKEVLAEVYFLTLCNKSRRKVSCQNDIT